jgi:hypothetical protein
MQCLSVGLDVPLHLPGDELCITRLLAYGRGLSHGPNFDRNRADAENTQLSAAVACGLEVMLHAWLQRNSIVRAVPLDCLGFLPSFEATKDNKAQWKTDEHATKCLLQMAASIEYVLHLYTLEPVLVRVDVLAYVTNWRCGHGERPSTGVVGMVVKLRTPPKVSTQRPLQDSLPSLQEITKKRPRYVAPQTPQEGAQKRSHHFKPRVPS